MLVRHKLPEDDLKQIKICESFSELYGKVYILILVHVFVLLIKKSYCTSIYRILNNVYTDVGKNVSIFISLYFDA